MSANALFQTVILEFIKSELLESGDTAQLTHETPLLEWGILDSVKMVELVAFIEQKFQVELDASEVSPHHFKNVQTICQLIKEKETRSVA